MKSNQIFRSVAVAIILVLMVILMPTTPALAQTVSVSPYSGIAGTMITVSGESFTTPATFTITFGFGSSSPRVGIGSGTVLTGGTVSSSFAVPEMPGGTYTIQVATSAGQALTTSFTITPYITLNKTSGSVGDEVTASGSGFAASSSVTVYFDNGSVGTAPTDANGKFTTATFLVPESYNGSHAVSIQDSAAHSATASFSTKQSIAIAPTTGASGDGVKVTGTGFKAKKSITITFGTLAVNTTPPSVTTDDKGSFTATFPVPLLVKGTYEASATDGTNKAGASFTVMAGASISQTIGNVGSEITVSGTGFTVGAKVTVTYDGKEIATPTVDNNGAFSATLKIPVSKHGTHSIVAVDSTNPTNTKTFTFTMESDVPPIPPPLTPEEGIKAKSPVSFDWEDVTDKSLPVIYNLQVATDKKFTDASIVLKKEGLTESEYTLTKEEKLKSTKKEAPYYWRVSATDSASNVSGWSTPGSFYVGFQWPELKGWLLYTLIVIGVLIFLILGFWLGRRTSYY